MKPKPRALASFARQPRNLWLVVGLAATVALAAVVVISFMGWFTDEPETRRGAVAAYIEEVNSTQREFAAERQTVSTVYQRALKNPRGLAGDVVALDHAVTTLRQFHLRVLALEPPPDANRLHRKLVALTAAEAAFAKDIALLGRFQTVLAAERRALARASQSLRTDLRTAPSIDAQAALFERFSAELETLAGPLRRGLVPAPLKPIKEEELTRITALATSAHALAGALRARSTAETAAQARAFAVSAAGNGNAVERAGILAYDDEARRINTLRAGVANEQARLERVLP